MFLSDELITKQCFACDFLLFLFVCFSWCCALIFFCTQLFFDIDAPLLDVVASSAFHSKILDDVYLND